MQNIKRWTIFLLIIIGIIAVWQVLTNKKALVPKQNTASKIVEQKLEVLVPNNFDESSINIDNKWLPLKPGAQHIYEGSTQEGDKRVPHRLVMTVTDLTKVIHGVRAVVVWDVDYSKGELLESELVFFAQDKDGNVWHLGQYRETYDNVEFVGGRVWLAGIDGAKAGIMMKAEPKAGTPSYSEGYAPPPFNWTDSGQVYQMGQKTCVPVNCYEDVLVIVESSKEEGPEAQQLKYYASDVGYIKVGWKGEEEKQRETLDLVKVEQLNPKAMAEVNMKALELEKRASMYGNTPPLEQAPSPKGI